MWFSSVYLKTLRGFRVPILGWGLGFGVLMAVVLAAVPSLIATPEARASLVALGPSFAWFADPEGNTIGHWKRKTLTPAKEPPDFSG